MASSLDHRHGSLFSPTRQQIGRGMASAPGVVRITAHNSRSVTGKVDGCVAHLHFEANGKLKPQCTCGGPRYCEHVFAVLLTEDLRRAGRLVASKPTPPVASAPRPTPAARPAPARRKATPRPTPAAPAWRQRLELAAEQLAAVPKRPAKAVAVRHPHYYVDLAQTQKLARLAVAVFFPTQRGQETILERPGYATDIDRLEPADQRLLGLLHIESATGHALVLPPSFSIPNPRATSIVPALFATGRVHLVASLRDLEVEPGPLHLDDGEPFRFGSELREQDGVAIVHGSIERTGERHAHPQVRCVLDGGYALVGECMLRVELGRGGPFARMLLLDGPLAAPLAEAPQLLQQVLELTADCPELAPPLPTCPAPPPQAVLLVQMKQAMTDYVPVELQFDYDSARTELQGPALLPPAAGGGPWRRRDRAAEQELHERLLQLGGNALKRTGMAGCFTLDRGHLARHLSTLVDGGFRVLADGVPLRQVTATRLSVHSGIDWFDVRGELQFEGGAVLPLPKALAALLRGERLVELGDRSTAVLPDAWLQQWQAFTGLGEAEGDGIRLRRSQATLLDAMLQSQQVELAADANYLQLRQRLQEFRGVAAAAEPKGFCGELRAYQRFGLGWMLFLRDLQLGGCLADDMGLGKTVQVLALLQHVHPGAGLPSLLVAPRSLLDNWRREAARFAPALRVLDFTGPDRWQRLPGSFAGFDLVLTTYGTCRVDAARFVAQETAFEYAILDEAQAISNELSQTSKAVRLLRARQRLALSGTPVQNHVGELWALFEFLNPGLLGRSKAFKRLLGQGDSRGRGIDLLQLRAAIAPFLLRRTKEEVLPELPEKQEQDIACDLDGTQQSTYEALRLHYRDKLLHGESSLDNAERFMVLEALLRLRQAACHEALLDPALAERGSAKLDALLPMLQEIADSGHKALVFSQFTSFLAIVRQRLEALGLAYEYLDGRTKKRQERVDRFQQDAGCPFFLISLKAGGFGLNLTAADYIFLLDPWWNPAAEAQAIDRAHRIGREEKVVAYRLIARDTVEEKVLQLQAEKRELVEAVMGADKSLLAKLSREDLAALLG